MSILCYCNIRLLGQVQCDKYQINTKVIPVQHYRLLEIHYTFVSMALAACWISKVWLI
jgi:hypothetical protein